MGPGADGRDSFASAASDTPFPSILIYSVRMRFGSCLLSITKLHPVESGAALLKTWEMTPFRCCAFFSPDKITDSRHDSFL